MPENPTYVVDTVAAGKRRILPLFKLEGLKLDILWYCLHAMTTSIGLCEGWRDYGLPGSYTCRMQLSIFLGALAVEVGLATNSELTMCPVCNLQSSRLCCLLCPRILCKLFAAGLSSGAGYKLMK